MIRREISEKVLQYSKQYPVITITGPRQSGKTTLCKMLFPDKAYISLEIPDERQFADRDPRGFLSRFPEGAVIDEIQRVPQLLSYIQVIVDEKQTAGMFIVTGSQNFELLNTISQSLAGRTALVKLLPFSLNEAYPPSVLDKEALENVLYTGFYPRIFDKKLNPSEAYSFYTATYVERDVRSLLNIKNLSEFEIFLKLCASRTGQVLNYSAIGNECGINHNTIRNWLSILEASYIIKILHPYYRNFSKRLIKAPKLYFLDTGLAAYLLEIKNSIHLINHPLKGALFETYVISELLKQRFNQGLTDNLFYYRDSKGNEVDVIIDQGIKFDCAEIKLSQTITSDFFKGIGMLRQEPDQVGIAYLIYGGDLAHTRGGVQIRGWKNIGRI